MDLDCLFSSCQTAIIPRYQVDPDNKLVPKEKYKFNDGKTYQLANFTRSSEIMKNNIDRINGIRQEREDELYKRK